MDSQDELRRLQSRLGEIDAAHEKTEGRGAILAGPGVYLSGFPYLFSADMRAAFVFKNCAQAARALADFNSLLYGFSVVPRQEDREAA
jgi:hypothetical protein